LIARMPENLKRVYLGVEPYQAWIIGITVIFLVTLS
jgi:hypothetical protein